MSSDLSTSSVTTPARQRPRLAKFLERVNARGRIILAVDATGSRQATWDTAAHIQAEMFRAVPAGLDVQLVYYRGEDCVASRWFADAESLAAIMSRIMCAAGQTQIRKVLSHTRKENLNEKVDALILISDACEEASAGLYEEARELPVPVFLFQEGHDERVAEIYQEIARVTGGASCKFDGNSAQRLTDLLKAVAAFAVGGVKALAAQKSDAATLLLTQIRK